MSLNLSVAEMLARLETKIAFHKEREDLHAREEAKHAEERAMHAEEHRQAVEQLEALKSAASSVGELIKGVAPAPKFGPLSEKAAKGRGHWIAELLDIVIDAKAPGEVFGATSLIEEIETRWGGQLRHGIDPRSAATTLRRWAADGSLDMVRKGTSHTEGLYTKPR
jgi:hypothetical protein